MPLYLSGAHSSRVTKPRKGPINKRPTSLPFLSTTRAKGLRQARFAASELRNGGEEVEEEEDYDLVCSGAVVSVIDTARVGNILSAVDHARATMFEALPERAGMNSVRISEVLNFQKNLPPLVSLAHVHALRTASSKTERELQTLLSKNKLRRIKLVGRGNEVSGLGELLISIESYEALLCKSGLDEVVVSSFRKALNTNPRAFALPPSSLPRAHLDLLLRHGFLVVPSIQGSGSSSAGRAHSIVSPTSVSKSASGSQAAVGGEAAFETLGGVNGVRRLCADMNAEYVLSVPGIAAFVQLLDASRTHFLDLLRRFSKHRQAPLYLLKERWNGNVDSDENQVSVAKRIRGEYATVAPAKTKKWKVFNGLAFDWVLEECLGAGLIELFETHSVGLGIRALV